jgi:hypothetical protein
MKFDFVIPVLYNDHDVAMNGDIAQVLARAGARVALIAHTRYGERELKRRGLDVFFLYEHFEPRRPLVIDDVTAIEKKYELGSLADFVFPEHMVPATNPQPMLFRRAVHGFQWLENFCSSHDVSLFLNNLGPEILRRCMFRLRDKGGPESVVLDFAPIHGRFALTTHEVTWDELPNELPTLTAAERQRMADFVATATAERRPFANPQSLTVAPRNLIGAFRYAQRALTERLDYSLPALFYQRAESVIRVRLGQHLYQRPEPGERFYFFPLHLMDDSAITIRAPQFQRQEDVVRYMAERVVPVGAKLYVKPHPGAMHAYSYTMLSTLAKIPNVRLIDPRVVSHSLIANAEAVIVINSSVGFEALLYGKPVVTLGRVFYRGQGLTTDVDQLAELPRAVADAVRRPTDVERMYRFLHACHEATYPGHLTQRTPENLELLTKALVAKAAKLGRPLEAAGPSDRARGRNARPHSPV